MSLTHSTSRHSWFFLLAVSLSLLLDFLWLYVQYDLLWVKYHIGCTSSRAPYWQKELWHVPHAFIYPTIPDQPSGGPPIGRLPQNLWTDFIGSDDDFLPSSIFLSVPWSLPKSLTTYSWPWLAHWSTDGKGCLSLICRYHFHYHLHNQEGNMHGGIGQCRIQQCVVRTWNIYLDWPKLSGSTHKSWDDSNLS